MAGVVVLALTLAGCGAATPSTGPVVVPHQRLDPAATKACRSFVAQLPHRVAGQPRRRVSGSPYAAAYGDPPIIVTCAAPYPAGLTNHSPCQEANGIGWFVPMSAINNPDADVPLATIGRDPRIAAVLPAKDRPPLDLLADLAPAVKAATARVSACQ